MNRDSGAESPGQRTVADLLKEYGEDSGSSQRGDRRRRRRAEDTTETAPHAIIDRVLSDSGQLRAIRPDEDPPPELRRSDSQQGGSQQGSSQGAAGHQQADFPQAGDQGASVPPAAQPSATQSAQPAPQPPAEPAQQPASPPPPGQQAPAQQPPTQQPPTQQPQAQQPPTQQPPTQQPPAQQSAQGGAEGFANAPVGAEGANFWAQRFAAAGAAPGQNPAQEQSAAGGDAEPTVQQQPLGWRPQPYPRAQAAGEDVTEKLPTVGAQERAGGTGMFAASAVSAPDGAAGSRGSQDFGADDFPAEDFADDFEDADDFGDGPYDYGSDGDLDRPAGLPAIDGVDDEERSPGREWVGQVAQAVVGLLCGAVVFFGFSWLWTKNSVAAFVAALVVTGCLVLLARRLRGDDLQTTLLAVLAGLFCTVSPAALLMLGQ